MDISTPTRQSLKGLVLIFLQSVRKFIQMVWALILVLFVQKNVFNNSQIFLIAGLIILTLLIIHSILYYSTFYFYIKDGEFILKKGYLRRKVLSIPIERIQSVNTKQHLIQQILDVVTLEIDTAGSSGKELKIHALNISFANALSEILAGKKTEAHRSEEQLETSTSNLEKLVLRLNPLDLLKIGISQNHLLTALIVIGFAFQIFDNIQDIFKEQADRYSNEFLNYMSGSGLSIIIFMILFFLILVILISLILTLVKYFDFKLLKRENAYRVVAGIINKRNVVLQHSKIQQLNWVNDPLKRLFGIYKVIFKQAVSKQSKNEQVVDAPGCLKEHLVLLKSDLFGEDQFSESTKINSNPYYFQRLWTFTGWLPILLASPLLFNNWIFWLIAGLWLLATAGYSFLKLKKSYFKIVNEQIQVSSGAISHKWKQMELFKIQAVEFKQSFFQKRKSLASLEIMNASGSINIPFIDQDLAKHIYDYLLYHTETSEKSWM